MQGADLLAVSNFSVLSKDTSTCGQVKPEIEPTTNPVKSEQPIYLHSQHSQRSLVLKQDKTAWLFFRWSEETYINLGCRCP